MTTLQLGALAPHKTAVSEEPWDGPANEANLRTGGDESYYRSAFAWEDDEADESTKSAYKFIHHFVSDDGSVGAASTRACSSGIAVLNGGRSGTTIPDADRQGVYEHLAKHLRDAGMEPPELMSIEQPVSHRFRGTPTFGGRTLPVVVDRENKVIKNVSIFQAGVEALGHGVMGDAITLGMLTELGNARPYGVKSRLGHPGMSEDGTAKQIGRLKSFRIQSDKVVADLHLLESADKSPKLGDKVTEWLMDYAEEAPEDFGMSVVILSDAVWRNEDGEEELAHAYDDPPEGVTSEFPLLRPIQLSAADIVDEPAANRDGLFHALNDGRYSAAWAADMFNEIDGYISASGVTVEKAYQFAMRYFGARGVNVTPAVGRTTEEQQMGSRNMLVPTNDFELDADLDETELDAADELQVEETAQATGAIEQLAEQLKLGEIVGLLGDVVARQADVDAEIAAMRASINELTDALADSQRNLARANGFPVVTESAELPYERVLNKMLNKSTSPVIDSERQAPPKAEVLGTRNQLDINALLGKATSRQQKDEKIANSLLDRWSNGG